jgi:hypothetical protein
MAGIMALGRFVEPEPLGWHLLEYSDENLNRQSRSGEGIAFLVAKLSTEKDSDVLPLLGQALLHADRPVELPLLLTANRRYAEEYARSSGEYSALSVLRLLDRTHAEQDDGKVSAARTEALRDLDHSLLRETAPLGNPASLNNKFQSYPFWGRGKYPFRSWFKEAEREGLSSGNPNKLNWRTRSPDAAEIKRAEVEAMKAAFNLMKTSILLAGIAAQDRSWIVSLPSHSLRGNAVVVGEMDKEVADELEGKGAYVQRDESDVSSDPL